MNKTEYDSINTFPIHLEYTEMLGSNIMVGYKPEIIFAMSKGEQVWDGVKREVFNTIDKRELPYGECERIRIIPKDWDKATHEPFNPIKSEHKWMPPSSLAPSAIEESRQNIWKEWMALPQAERDAFLAILPPPDDLLRKRSDAEGYIIANRSKWHKSERSENELKKANKECIAEASITIHSAKAQFKGSLYSDDSVSFSFDGISNGNTQEIERVMEVIRDIFRENLGANPPPTPEPSISDYILSQILKQDWVLFCKNESGELLRTRYLAQYQYQDDQFEINTGLGKIRIRYTHTSGQSYMIYFPVINSKLASKERSVAITYKEFEQLRDLLLGK